MINRVCLSALRLGALGALVAVAACAQLKEVREFAEQSAQLAGYTKIVDDDLQSFERRAELTPEDARASVLAAKERRALHRERLLALHGAIELYMHTIGKLAADKTVDYAAEVQSMSNNLQKLDVTDAEASAYARVAGLIARAITDGYRQRELPQMIRSAQAPIQVLLKAMGDFAEMDYADNTLALEANALRSFYTPILATAKDNKEAAALSLAQALYADKQKPIRQRQENARAFAAIVGRIAAGHTMLYEGADAIDSKLVLDTIKDYAQQIKDTRKQLRELD